MRIKFLANGPINNIVTKPNYRVYVNPAYFMMKHYHTLHGKHKPTWLLPEFIATSTAQEQVDLLVRNRVNLLLLACFVWNMDLQMEIAKLYRKQVPRGRVVVGGPQLTAHKDPQFFEKYPYVDYAVYGDGEKALSNIIDYLSSGSRGRPSRSTRSPWVNTVENVNGKAHVWPFEVLKDEKYWSTSPFLTQKKFIRDSIEKIYKEGFTKKHVVFAIEFARGCMYKCAYCDWSQNLTKKVTRRKAEWKLELDFFCELDVQIRETDANFGQWDQDIEIYNYAKSLHKHKNNFRFFVSNTSKLKKNSHHFYIGNGKWGGEVKFSLEDTEEVPLKAMNRPSLTWEQHQEVMATVRDKLGAQFNRLAVAELILGMPKQSIKTFKENFKKLITEGLRILPNHLVLAPNSPAGDPLYTKEHRIEWKTHYLFQGHDSKNPGAPDSIDELYKTAPTNPQFVKQSMVWKTNDMEYVDIITVLIAGALSKSTMLRKQIIEIYQTAVINHDNPDMSAVVDLLFDHSAKLAKAKLAQHKEAIEKYGFVVPGLIYKNKWMNGWGRALYYHSDYFHKDLQENYKI